MSNFPDHDQQKKARRKMRGREFFPSVGFLFILLSISLSVIFFAWGWQRPPLEVIWQMDIELGLGKRAALTSEEFELLQKQLNTYPILADHLIEDKYAGIFSANDAGCINIDYAYLIRTSKNHPRFYSIKYDGIAKRKEMDIRIRMGNQVETCVLRDEKPCVFTPDLQASLPALIEFRFLKKAKKQIVCLRENDAP